MNNRISHIQIDSDIFTIEDAINAARELFEDQTGDFEQIKNRKWYHHFLNALTVQVNDKKKIIKDIRSLAKLQELFMMVYANQYAALDAQLNEIIDNIRKVNAFAERLYDSCVLEIRSQKDIRSMSKGDQELLLLFLAEYHSIKHKDYEMSVYRRNVQSLMNAMLPESGFSAEQLCYVTSPEIFYRCALELCAIDDLIHTLAMPENISEAIEYLNLSPKKKEKIIKTLMRELEVFGYDYPLEKYKKNTNQVTDIDIVFEEESQEEQQQSSEQKESHYHQSSQLTDDLKEKKKNAEKAVAAAVDATAATGAIPIPFADAPLLIGEQVALMGSICGIYGIDVGKDGLKMLATTVLGTSSATIVGKTIATNLIKMVPIAGSVVGGAISAGTAGLVTLAMGNAFIALCNMVKQGDLSESDITSSKGKSIMKDLFKEQVKKNKDKQ